MQVFLYKARQYIMVGLHIVMQLLAKNNITLDKDDEEMIKDNTLGKIYDCDPCIISADFTILHKLVLLRITNKYPKFENVINEYILLYPEEIDLLPISIEDLNVIENIKVLNAKN